MNGSLTTSLAIPEGFPEILRDLTREVLRDQPDNVYTYGAAYFERLLADSYGGRDDSQVNAHKDIDMESLEIRIGEMFDAADTEQKGYLSREQATSIVRNVATELSFTEEQINYIMTEADENHDGLIDFQEFMPLMMEMVQLIFAKTEVEEKLRRDMDTVQDKLLHGMSRDQLNSLLLSVFRAADTDGSGALDRKEFQSALKNTDLGLTRKEINGIMHAVELNENGEVSYDAFIPLAFELCAEIYARQLAHETLPSGDAEIAQYFTDLFASADTDMTGKLPYSTLAQLIRQSDLGMSKVQIHTVLALAKKDDEGMVNYNNFATSAATMIGSMLNFEDSAQRLELRREESFSLVAGMDEVAFTEALANAFASVDASGVGQLGLEPIQDAIFGVHPECTGEEMNALLSLLVFAEDSEAESYAYDDLIRYAWQVLVSQKEMMAVGNY